MPNKILSIHPKNKKVKDEHGHEKPGFPKSHDPGHDKPTGQHSITKTDVIVSYKIGTDEFLLYAGKYYAVGGDDFYIDYNDDSSITIKKSSDNSVINAMPSAPAKAMITDIEHIVISHVEGSCWRLIYFNGRYYWVMVPC